ncbi:MAG: CPBP family intramembrane metalloprotease [Chloroflexi bacterium]|nr:CPBP family intramembrane metalloprotease [Chloroflexota bacterium]
MIAYLLGKRMHFDWKIVAMTVVSTLLLIFDRYHNLTSYKYLDRVFLYLVIPILLIVILFREHPREYGMALGDWKRGLTYTVIGILVMTPIIYFLGRGNTAMKEYYERFLEGLPWTTFLDLIGWEFIFRGWLLFGYSRKFGVEALWLQAVPFAVAHISKPEIETLSTIFGGFAFGWVAWQTRSFVWPFLIHWYIASFVIIVAAGSLG